MDPRPPRADVTRDAFSGRANHEGRRRAAPTTSARVLNAALGVWLFMSAFAWPHTLEQRKAASPA